VIEIYTDGACRGNHGPGGWGALLRSGEHEKELWGGELDTTNNRMEMTAVVQALTAKTGRLQHGSLLKTLISGKRSIDWLLLTRSTGAGLKVIADTLKTNGWMTWRTVELTSC